MQITLGREKYKAGKVIAKRFKEYRKEHGYTQTQAASQIGIKQSNWSAYERGDVFPPLGVILELADVSEWNIEYILGFSHTKSMLHATSYDLLRLLSVLFLYTGMTGELTEEGDLILKAKGDPHEKMIKSVMKQALEYAEEWKGYGRDYYYNLRTIEINHKIWLDEKKYQYWNEELTGKREEMYPDVAPPWAVWKTRRIGELVDDGTEPIKRYSASYIKIEKELKEQRKQKRAKKRNNGNNKNGGTAN